MALRELRGLLLQPCIRALGLVSLRMRRLHRLLGNVLRIEKSVLVLASLNEAQQHCLGDPLASAFAANRVREHRDFFPALSSQQEKDLVRSPVEAKDREQMRLIEDAAAHREHRFEVPARHLGDRVAEELEERAIGDEHFAVIVERDEAERFVRHLFVREVVPGVPLRPSRQADTW